MALCGCTASEQDPPSPTPTAKETTTTTPDDPTTDAATPSASAELTELATNVGLTDLEPAPTFDLAESPGLAGWWDYMFVGIWLASEPILPANAEPTDTVDFNGVTASRYSTADGPAATFTCNDRYIMAAILGTDDNVVGTDPFDRYTQAVIAAACP